MTQAACNYGRILYDLGVPESAVAETVGILKEVPEVKRILCHPLVKQAQKLRVIERVFPKEMENFLKVVLRHGRMDTVEDMADAYHAYAMEQQGILAAELRYVTEPDLSQLDKIKGLLSRKYGRKAVALSMVCDPSLIGGFVIKVKDVETDWSMKGRLKQLEQVLTRR